MKLLIASTLCLLAATASAEEAPREPAPPVEDSPEEAVQVEVPETQNPYIPVVAALYEVAKYEEALSKLERALEKANGEREVVWLKLMQGVLQAELAQGTALESFKEALALNEQAELPVKGSRRLRRLFEQARNTVGLPVDAELLAEEYLLETGGPPPRPQGWSVSLRAEGDVAWVGTSSVLPPAAAVSVGYSGESLGGAVTVLVQSMPGLRAEGRYHPLTLGWVRPYAGLGATALFLGQDGLRNTAPFGGVSGRVVLGADVQFTARMNAFLEVGYERFLGGPDRYGADAALVSIGVGWFP